MIYVDEIRDYQQGKFSHMWTDGSIEELHNFASRLGLKRHWIHHSKGISGNFSHYDIVPSKRSLAIRYGAQYIPLRDWITKRLAEKDTPKAGDHEQP